MLQVSQAIAPPFDVQHMCLVQGLLGDLTEGIDVLIGLEHRAAAVHLGEVAPGVVALADGDVAGEGGAQRPAGAVVGVADGPGSEAAEAGDADGRGAAVDPPEAVVGEGLGELAVGALLPLGSPRGWRPYRRSFRPQNDVLSADALALTPSNACDSRAWVGLTPHTQQRSTHATQPHLAPRADLVLAATG